MVKQSGCSVAPTNAQFTVYEIEQTASAVSKLAVDVVHYCQGNAWPLYLYIRLNSTVPVNKITDTVPAPFQCSLSSHQTSATINMGGVMLVLTATMIRMITALRSA